jgi:ATP-dependent helicase HrpA
VPVPESAAQALEQSWQATTGFNEWMALWITHRAGEPVIAADIAALPIPEHLRMNVRVIDAHDHVIAEGRELPALKRQLRLAIGRSRVDGREPEAPAALHRRWDFGALAESTEIEGNRFRIVSYPAIEDRGDGVALLAARDPITAERLTRAAVARLAMLALPHQTRYLRARILESRELLLLSHRLALDKPLPDALIERAFRECFVPDDRALPRNAEEFAAMLEAHRGNLSDVADRLAALVLEVLREWRAVRGCLEELASPTFSDAVADIEAQIAGLLRADFLATTPRAWLDELPKYFKAIERRVERLRGNVQRDAELARKARRFNQALGDLMREPAAPAARPAIEQLRWMIEEFRVSLHAQELRTSVRVSEQRLAEQVARARAAVHS